VKHTPVNEKLPNTVIHAWKNITEQMNLLKMCGPQIRLCLFTFRPIASKSLNSLTTIDILCWLGGAEVTYPLWVREVPGLIPGSGKGFDFWFGVFCVFTVCPKTHDLLQNFAIPCAMLIYLVYLTYCKICDQLQGYKDTDLAYLMLCVLRSEVLFEALCICTVLIF